MLKLTHYLVMLLAISQPAFTNSEPLGSPKPSLTIYTEHFPPYSFIRNNQIMGVNIDIVKRLCELNTLTCNLKLLPWNRAFRLAQDDVSSALVSTSRTPQREPQFQWVGPLVNGTTYLYKRAERSDIVINDKSDLLKYTTGVPRNDIYDEVLLELGFEKGVNLLEMSSKNEAFRLQALGKLDLVIGSDNVMGFYKLNQPVFPLSDYEPVFKVPIERLQGNYLAVNLNVEKSTVSALQKALDNMLESGEIETIKARYVSSHPD